MGIITTTQPGGVSSFSGNGNVSPGAGLLFSYAGTTTSYTWTLLTKPTGSAAAIVSTGATAKLAMDVAVNGSQYTVRFTDSAAANTDVVLTVVTAYGSGLIGTSVRSLIPPHLRFSGFLPLTTTLTLHDRQDSVDNLLDAMVLNIGANVTFGVPGEVVYYFGCPPGCVGGTFSVRAKMFTGAANNTCRIRILDSNLTPIVTAQCAVTSTAKTFSVTATSGLDSTNYFAVAIAVNDLEQQCKLAVGSLQFDPIFSSLAATSPTFLGNFIRLHVQPQIVSSNQLAGVYPAQGIGVFSSPFSEIVMDTDATSVAYEAYNGGTDGLVYVLYDEQPYSAPTAVTNGKVQIRDVALPPPPASMSRRPRVTVRNGTGIGPIVTIGQPAAWVSTRAIYLPDGCKWEIAPPPPYEGICIGDSVHNGELSTYPGFSGYMAILRQWYGSLTLETYSAQALYDAVGPTGTDTVKQKAYAHYMVRKRPRDLFFGWSLNDWARGNTDATWTAAVYQTALNGLLTQAAAYSPTTRFWLLGAGITTQEGANAAGSTRVTYNTAMAAVATALGPPQFTYIDMRAAGFHTSAQLADPVHPSQLGHAMDAAALIAYLQASPRFVV